MAQSEEGADILYDEPRHAINSMDRESWTPRYVDLSSLWVYKVVRNENIPRSVRYQMWPNTINSKAGLQSGWQMKGRLSITYSKSRRKGKESWKEIRTKQKRTKAARHHELPGNLEHIEFFRVTAVVKVGLSSITSIICITRNLQHCPDTRLLWILWQPDLLMS